jgi:hypothetical protein
MFHGILQEIFAKIKRRLYRYSFLQHPLDPKLLYFPQQDQKLSVLCCFYRRETIYDIYVVDVYIAGRYIF